MEWISGIGIIVLIVAVGGGLLYGIYWLVTRQARLAEQGKKLEESGPTAEEVVDAAVKKGFSIPKLMAVIAGAAIVVMGILSRTQG